MKSNNTNRKEIIMSNQSSGSGVGIGTLLFIVFLVLKLCGTITWSWWWVTAPLWGGIALWIVGVVIGILIYFTLTRNS